ncbi:hypothetical protein JOD02_001821 [Caldicoprobacter guelmensis]|uniref:spore coat associated protein CotJA n=1 Tax=Caldicoprobacter guelmensis TaxID=1170224 RepID=UPI001959F754|nr:spore coat associated protein CotJA [Caldicoprobacter guelmensis]MBM7582952.1 hypothetical protein [Caldicoprobacter guelmensis]
MDYRYPEHYLPRAPYMYGYPMWKRVELAEAYIPYQRYITSLSPMEALHAGTMFPELIRPYDKNDCEGGRGL